MINSGYSQGVEVKAAGRRHRRSLDFLAGMCDKIGKRLLMRRAFFQRAVDYADCSLLTSKSALKEIMRDVYTIILCHPKLMAMPILSAQA